MRGQSAVIGTMLFFVAVILVGAIFLSLVSKTVKLLDAGRMEIEFHTRSSDCRSHKDPSSSDFSGNPTNTISIESYP